MGLIAPRGAYSNSEMSRLITKQFPLLDDVDLGRHHDFPGRITRLDFRQTSREKIGRKASL